MKIKFFNLRSALLVPFTLLPLFAQAKPSGGSVVNGKATFYDKGDVFQVRSSDKAIVNWESFSIGEKETVQIDLPDNHSSILNRVLSNNPTHILGRLASNGQVFLINQNGILVGKDGVVHCAQFAGSTLDLADADFIKGNDLHFSGIAETGIVNLGKIECDGDVLLIGTLVENKGTAVSRYGDVHFAAGTSVVVQSRDSDRIFVKVDAPDGLKGVQTELKHAQSNPYALAINNEGIVQASSLKKEGGRVFLTAQRGQVSNSGLIAAERGSITVTGETVHLKDASSINVSGTLGGGNVYVGGGYEGSDPQIKNALAVVTDRNAQIRADAVDSGNGGKVIVWADVHNCFLGTVSAKGQGTGSGGMVEVSSTEGLYFDGLVSVASPHGAQGKVQFDPISITVQAANPNVDGLGMGNDLGSVGQLGTAANYPAVNSVITSGALNNLLTGGVSLTLAAYDSITVNDPIKATGAVSGFALNAPTVHLNETIDLEMGGILSGNAHRVYVGSSGIIQNGIDIASSGGVVTLSSAVYEQEVRIAGKNLSLIGSGIGNTTVRSPSMLNNSFAYTGTVYKPVILASGAETISIENLTIDGNLQGSSTNDKFLGVGYYNAGGAVANVRITNVQDSARAGGAQRGIAVFAASDAGPYEFGVTDCLIDQFQKGGISIKGGGLNVNIIGNTILGSAPYPVSTSNGITVQDGASGVVSSNQISNIHSGTAGEDSCAILAFNAGHHLSIIGNNLIDNDVGIYCFNCGDQLAVNYNSCMENRFAGVAIDAPIGSTLMRGNTLSGNAVQGMYVNSAINRQVTLSENTFVGGSNGLVVVGGGTTGPVVTMNSDIFSNIGDKYITLVQNPNDLWSSTQTVSFDGMISGQISYEQFLGIEAKIVDKHRDPSLGVVLDFIPPAP